MDAKFIERVKMANDNLLYLYARLNYNDVLFNRMLNVLIIDYADTYRDVRSLNLEIWDKITDEQRYVLFVEQCRVNAEIKKMINNG